MKMAYPVSADSDIAPEQDSSNDEQHESFWLDLMAECQANAPNKLPSSKSILFLGDNDAGKSQLVARLQGTGEKLRKGNGLEYHFLNVRDEYGENQTKLDVWILDEDPCFQRLLKYVLNSDVISDTTVILTASMAKPWNIFYSICTWVEILEHHIRSLNIPPNVLEEQKSRVLDRYRKYVEPTQSIYGSLEESCSSEEIENNLGLDIIVVITNTDYMNILQSEFGYVDEHFDFIQLTLRKFCLSYGAALLYVSVNEDRNCDILLKYILHRVYSFPFRIPAMFLDRDSIFVPAGWDNENKIVTLAETLATIAFSSPFEDVIIKPSRLGDGNRIVTEIEAQNDQDFLHFIETGLRQPIEISDVNRDGSFSSTSSQRNSSRRISRSPGVRSPQKKLEAKISSGEGDTVLHTFFKSLLNRRTSAPVDRPIGMSGHRGYNPPIGLQKSSNISLDSNNSNINGSDIHAEEDTLEQMNCMRKTISDIESLPVVDELNSDKCSSKVIENPNHSSMNSSDPFSELLKRYKSDQISQSEKGKAEFDKQNPPRSSLDDDDDKNFQPLPEYFMSSQSANHCLPDCSFQNNKSEFTDDLLDDMAIDRVNSKFNPPLRLLLEKSYDAVRKPIRNGHEECLNRASSSAQHPIEGLFLESSIQNGNAESTISSSDVAVPDLLKESLPSKIEIKKENPMDKL